MTADGTIARGPGRRQRADAARVETGDIWRACQTKDADPRLVKLAVTRASPTPPAIFCWTRSAPTTATAKELYLKDRPDRPRHQHHGLRGHSRRRQHGAP
ncbi:NADP-dependent isocitrate dehydrogenase [Pseudomonas aeruginosa]|nr:NADP-dependent isocitrate dehydrogenase [Pseudomonas aeruginosa]